MAHADIRITFEVEGRRFEAVGFFKEGDRFVDGNEMFSRTLRGQFGTRELLETDDFWSWPTNWETWPESLRPYRLTTGVDPDFPCLRMPLYYWGTENGRSQWFHSWFWNNQEVDSSFLVVRRLPDASADT